MFCAKFYLTIELFHEFSGSDTISYPLDVGQIILFQKNDVLVKCIC